MKPTNMEYKLAYFRVACAQSLKSLKKDISVVLDTGAFPRSESSQTT